nr:uncharacterized protein LOC127337970 [Lolium perenne]
MPNTSRTAHTSALVQPLAETTARPRPSDATLGYKSLPSASSFATQLLEHSTSRPLAWHSSALPLSLDEESLSLSQSPRGGAQESAAVVVCSRASPEKEPSVSSRITCSSWKRPWTAPSCLCTASPVPSSSRTRGPTPRRHLGAPLQSTIVLGAAHAHVYADDQEKLARPRHRAEPPRHSSPSQCRPCVVSVEQRAPLVSSRSPSSNASPRSSAPTPSGDLATDRKPACACEETKPSLLQIPASSSYPPSAPMMRTISEKKKKWNRTRILFMLLKVLFDGVGEVQGQTSQPRQAIF